MHSQSNIQNMKYKVNKDISRFERIQARNKMNKADSLLLRNDFKMINRKRKITKQNNITSIIKPTVVRDLIYRSKESLQERVIRREDLNRRNRNLNRQYPGRPLSSYEEIYNRTHQNLHTFSNVVNNLSDNSTVTLRLNLNIQISSNRIDIQALSTQTQMNYNIQTHCEDRRKDPLLCEKIRNLSLRQYQTDCESYLSMDRCPICIEQFKNKEQIVQLPCKHIYHPNCIKKWFSESPLCPICKVDIRKNN